MRNDYQGKAFQKWLNKLQRESWQLELIISGFALYGLFQALDPIKERMALNSLNGETAFFQLWFITWIALYILLFNLMLHVLLRGLWIGAIGLRYVSGDIDYKALDYSPRFTSFLKQKVGSFDRYIAQLENYCSILFALSFLLIFYVIGGFIALTVPVFLIDSIYGVSENYAWGKYVAVTFAVIYLLALIIVFIDFLGQGILKRKKWVSKIYFPIYRVFGFLTLSFLYRPLVYNFLDNRFGRRLGLFLTPIYLVIVYISSLEYRTSNFLGASNESSELQITRNHYENLSEKEDTYIRIAAIPAKVIEKKHLKVFLLYSKEMEDGLFEQNPHLEPAKDQRGFRSRIMFDFKMGRDEALNVKDTLDFSSYMTAVNQLYTLKIDSLSYPSQFVASTNAKNRLGFETYLNVKDLREGKHVLTISGPAKEIRANSQTKTTQKILVTIPFWYFPQTVQIPGHVPNLGKAKLPKE